MTTIAILAIILYLISWVLLGYKIRSRLNHTPPINKKIHLSVWSCALLLHATVLYYPMLMGNGLSISMITAASHIIWLTSLVLLITMWTRDIEALGIFILPLTAFTLLLQQTVTLDSTHTVQISNGLGAHIFTSLLAYSMLMLAAIQAALLAEQNNHLHNHKPTGFIRALPSLQDMEHLLFRFITLGVILLSIALITGFIYLDNLFGQGIAHKTILSIFAWFIFTTLLIGHLRFGWRGRTAIRWTLAGFVILMLAFFGSKIIQHFIGQ
ncbi:MAG: cytochrome c biogenesis protein CcsA [Cocleimonas sp.]|nr:cytochrome c biogenesis protein CcsA [Cocleimonas sp.]